MPIFSIIVICQRRLVEWLRKGMLGAEEVAAVIVLAAC
jgi:hypothetical protein